MEVENSPFELTKRRGLIVWVYSLKQLKNLKRFGLLHYVSRRMKYVVLYMDADKVEQNIEKINRFHFVRKVEPSYRPDIEMNFSEKIGKKDHLNRADDGFEVEEMTTTIRLAENI